MDILKTIKLYIDGKFPRTESGRSYTHTAQGKDIARVCQASRKDFRNSIESNKKAQPGWAGRTAYNRAQILYRMGEMAQGKSAEFRAVLKDSLGLTDAKAKQSVQKAIDAFVYYAGFADKFSQVTGAVNPVAGPYHNFTTPDPVGVVVLIDSDSFDFAKLAANIASIICSGNATTVLLSKQCPAVLAPLAEVFATSDLPGGVVNLLTGHVDELYKHIAAHREVRSISFQNENEKIFFEMKATAVNNMKRMVPMTSEMESLENILSFVEYKTVWHPIGV